MLDTSKTRAGQPSSDSSSDLWETAQGTSNFPIINATTRSINTESRPGQLKTTSPASKKMAENDSPLQCCHGYSGSQYRKNCCHGQDPPDHCHQHCCPGHCGRKRNGSLERLHGCQTCVRTQKESERWLEEERERERIEEERREDRKRRQRDPNYVPTVDDRLDDAADAAGIVGLVGILAYVVLRWMRSE